MDVPGCVSAHDFVLDRVEHSPDLLIVGSIMLSISTQGIAARKQMTFDGAAEVVDCSRFDCAQSWSSIGLEFTRHRRLADARTWSAEFC